MPVRRTGPQDFQSLLKPSPASQTQGINSVRVASYKNNRDWSKQEEFMQRASGQPTGYLSIWLENLGPHTVERGAQSCCKPAWQEPHCNTTSTPDAVVSHTKQGTVSHEVHQQSTASATQEASPVCICHRCYGSRWQTGHLKSLTLNSNPGRILWGCVPEPSYFLLSWMEARVSTSIWWTGPTAIIGIRVRRWRWVAKGMEVSSAYPNLVKLHCGPWMALSARSCLNPDTGGDAMTPPTQFLSPGPLPAAPTNFPRVFNRHPILLPGIMLGFKRNWPDQANAVWRGLPRAMLRAWKHYPALCQHCSSDAQHGLCYSSWVHS